MKIPGLLRHSRRSPLYAMEEAGKLVERISRLLPMQAWMVSKVDGLHWMVQIATDNEYGFQPGHRLPWQDTLCYRAAKRGESRIVPDISQDLILARAAMARTYDVGACISLPILDHENNLCGTLCGLDPGVQSEEIIKHAELLETYASILSELLRLAEMDCDASRAIERSDRARYRNALGMYDDKSLKLFNVTESERMNHMGLGGALLQIKPPRHKGQIQCWEESLDIVGAIRDWVEQNDYNLCLRDADQSLIVLMTEGSPARCTQEINELKVRLKPFGYSETVHYRERKLGDEFLETIV